MVIMDTKHLPKYGFNFYIILIAVFISVISLHPKSAAG
jgi:hypothetical protein